MQETEQLDLRLFDDFARLCGDQDIERYRESFWTMLDMNGVIPSLSVGFNFEIDDESERLQFVEMMSTFAPAVVWVGTHEMQKQLLEMGFSSTVVPYFEDGGFMLVLKTPIQPNS